MMLADVIFPIGFALKLQDGALEGLVAVEKFAQSKRGTFPG